ncbi:MAG: redoxin domain-containing protein [Sphingobacteriales bacterium]|nr:redoxin domain-containing protein [Sphingobacteriales bacterium]
MTIYHWLFAITLSLVSNNTYSCPQNILSNSKFVASIHKQNEQMPNFKFYDLNGQLFTPQQLSYKNYLTFIFYDVDCDHCQEQAAAIAKNIKHFKKTTLLWVTIGEDSKIEAFKQNISKIPKRYFF